MATKASSKNSDKPKKKKIYKQVFISPDRNYKRKYVGYDDGTEKATEKRTIKGVLKGAPKKSLSKPTMSPDRLEELLIPVQSSNELTMKKKGGSTDKKWMQKVSASIERRGTAGKCTPITKPGCTGKARTLALTFKKIAKANKKK